MKFKAIPTPVVPRQDPQDPALMAQWGRVYARAAERLKARIEEHGLQEVEYAPGGDMVVIYRLPERKTETKTASGIVIPSASMSESMGGAYDDKGRFVPGKSFESINNTGLLIAAGPEAADILEGKGFFPGDYVVFSKFAGDEETIGRVNEAISTAAAAGKTEEEAVSLAKSVRDRMLEKKMLLRMRCGEIQASRDLAIRLYSANPELELVRQVSEKGSLHIYRPTMKG